MIAADILTCVAILLLAFAIWDQSGPSGNAKTATKTYLIVAAIMAAVSLGIRLFA